MSSVLKKYVLSWHCLVMARELPDTNSWRHVSDQMLPYNFHIQEPTPRDAPQGRAMSGKVLNLEVVWQPHNRPMSCRDQECLRPCLCSMHGGMQRRASQVS